MFISNFWQNTAYFRTKYKNKKRKLHNLFANKVMPQIKNRRSRVFQKIEKALQVLQGSNDNNRNGKRQFLFHGRK